jgi:hypothetical protein
LRGRDAGARVEQLFVVRIWREAGARERSYRGYIVDVATQQRRYFSEVADVVEFIRLHFDVKKDF